VGRFQFTDDVCGVDPIGMAVGSKTAFENVHLGGLGRPSTDTFSITHFRPSVVTL
jgi:hypothetical protein